MKSSSSRERRLLAKYGISSFHYALLLKKQGGVCAVCRKPPALGKNLCVDHDHKDGEIRGLLCGYCNRYVVARFTRSTLLRAAADYLDAPPAVGFCFDVVPSKRKKTHASKRSSL